MNASFDGDSIDVIYTARVRAEGGRAGTVTSQTGNLKLDLARPAERGAGLGTDPEELFAAGYSACFDSALAVVARREKINIGPTTTTVSVSLLVSEGSKYGIAVAIHVDAPKCPQSDLEHAVMLANKTCPYSLAVHGNIDVSLSSTGVVT